MGCNCNKKTGVTSLEDSIKKMYQNQDTTQTQTPTQTPISQKSYNILDVIKDKLKGKLESVDDTTKEKRLEVCDKCSYLIHLTRNCKLCGCFVDLKAQFKKSTCPKSFW